MSIWAARRPADSVAIHVGTAWPHVTNARHERYSVEPPCVLRQTLRRVVVDPSGDPGRQTAATG